MKATASRCFTMDAAVYPASGFAGVGTIGGQPVDCLTAEVQLLHHLGYDPDEADWHDMALLRDRFELALPHPYIEARLNEPWFSHDARLRPPRRLRRLPGEYAACLLPRACRRRRRDRARRPRNQRRHTSRHSRPQCRAHDQRTGLRRRDATGAIAGVRRGRRPTRAHPGGGARSRRTARRISTSKSREPGSKRKSLPSCAIFPPCSGPSRRLIGIRCAGCADWMRRQRFGRSPSTGTTRCIAVAGELGSPAVSLFAGAYDVENAAKLRDAGLRAVIWTVNDPEEARRVRDLGAHAICTDHPERIAAALSTS